MENWKEARFSMGLINSQIWVIAITLSDGLNEAVLCAIFAIAWLLYALLYFKTK